MMNIRKVIKEVLYTVGLKKRPQVVDKIEQWRQRGVTIGENFDAPDSAIDFCFGHLVNIGNNVTISGTTILAHDGSTKKPLGYSKVAPVKIGNDVFIGYGSVVLPGVTVGNKVIVGANTVCSKDIPDNSVVVQGSGGNYRFLCTYDEYIAKQKDRMERLPVSNVLFSDKTDEQWTEWKKSLEQYGVGFDL